MEKEYGTATVHMEVVMMDGEILTTKDTLRVVRNKSEDGALSEWNANLSYGWFNVNTLEYSYQYLRMKLDIFIKNGLTHEDRRYNGYQIKYIAMKEVEISDRVDG